MRILTIIGYTLLAVVMLVVFFFAGAVISTVVAAGGLIITGAAVVGFIALFIKEYLESEEPHQKFDEDK